MIPISVCIIAKNEEKNIENCLKAIYKHPFEIVVVDTGSTDKTKEIAAKYANKVLDFEWVDDFSAARNYSLQQATNDWVLIIDCDEVIQEIDYSEIQSLIQEFPYAIGRIKHDNLCYDKSHNIVHSFSLTERLFDKRRFHYEGSIHEQVVSYDSSEQLYGFEVPLTVSHTGYLGTEEDLEAKSARNIALLKHELLHHPDDPYLFYQLGESYMLKNDYESAYEYFDKGFYLEVDENLEYVQRMIISYGYTLLYTNRIEKALSLANVYDSFKSNADFVFLMGNIYLNARLYDKALIEYLRATSLHKHFDEGTNSYKAFHCIGCIYEAHGQTEEAIKYFRKAGDYAPSKEKLLSLTNQT